MEQTDLFRKFLEFLWVSIFLSLQSQKIVVPPINQSIVPPTLSPIHAEADLDSGLDIDTAGLTSTIHNELVKVSTTLASLPNCT